MTNHDRAYDPDLRALAASFKALQAHDSRNRPTAFVPREADPRMVITRAAWAYMRGHAAEFDAQGFDAVPPAIAEALTSEERDTLREGWALIARKARKE